MRYTLAVILTYVELRNQFLAQLRVMYLGLHVLFELISRILLFFCALDEELEVGIESMLNGFPRLAGPI